MSDQTPALPRVVSREEWLEQRKRLLAREKEMTRARDAVSAERRRLPMVAVDKDYVFEGPDGRVRLLDLFEGRRQLVVYHFMFGPDWEKGCPGCTHLTDEIGEGHLRHLHERDTSYAAVSRAPLAKLEAYKRSRGWTLPWYSSLGSPFNYDFHVTLDESVMPMEYNFRNVAEHRQAGTQASIDSAQPMERPGFSFFLREGERIFHTYSTYARGGEMIGGSHYILDLTVYGRQQEWEDSPAGWPQQPTYG
ncbi:MAG TPA: DUF899 domain-containing protein [Nevskia sp.]|nr:DUF899 domain-containing protein [Nevskia sp.]